ncbi:hypothetical protein BCIN_01g09130 [Botrytis cinerea B05.10]|uniref:Phosphoglycerate mutase family protein n=1 Tax=Botryotinia fuckeliana (strain B05.10) TaxID=332648 RepID=A0A384J6X6_BOTFB|nr:hypothetical protein BCIN_01g09130 [Botrytis cinerea B05.10]ATZ46289.1 hypothetical protein BCIN_01g09130 [Botrytis cinerea B05.10]
MGFWSRKSSPPPLRHREGVKSKHYNPAPKNAASSSASPPKSKSKATLKPTSQEKPKEKPKEKSKSSPRRGRIIVHFVRHAEAYNNLHTPHSRTLTDPLLTPLGKSQCHTLLTQLTRLKPVRILCSPLRRTLQTALLSLPSQTRIPITVDPLLREYGSVPNCTGSPIKELRRRHANVGMVVDFEGVQEGWERNRERDGMWVDGRWRRSREQRERGRRVLERLWEVGWEGVQQGKGDVEILVISHGEFLHGLTGNYWHNADIISLTMIKSSRGYEFIDPPLRYAYH